jgi:ChrR Cupin-like domain
MNMMQDNTIEPGDPGIELRERLMQRVQRSHAHEGQFQTVRRDAGQWQALDGGGRCKLLATTVVAQSLLVELTQGTALAVRPGATQQEVVLLSGKLSVGGQSLNCGDAVCSPHDAAHTLRAGLGGARLYLRLSSPLGTIASLRRFSAVRDDATWQDFSPGVRIKELWDGGERRSVLVRMRAGASVNSHSHGLEEECMMLAGEAFVGDTLLRSSDYQLAPQGSRHGALHTDMGALFFVHGSLDPAAYA